jgi:hypothetical protein
VWKYLAAAIAAVMMAASSASAQEHVLGVTKTSSLFAAPTSLAPGTDEPDNVSGLRQFRPRHRPWPLPILYGSSAFLNAYDAYLTLTGLEAGASEANPFMKPITRSPAAFIAVKAGLTAASIVGAEQLWKDHHRKSAVAVMVLSNAIMVAIAAQNTSVVQRIK